MNLNFTLTDNTTYAGKQLFEFFSDLLITSPSIGSFRTFGNVKSKIKVPKYDAGNVLQTGSCSPSASGEGTLDEKEMEVCDFDIYMELCLKTFEQNFLSEKLPAGANIEQVAPKEFTDYMINQVLTKAAANLETIAWQGDSATASYPIGLCDGLRKKLLADGTVVDVTATASTISAANVVGEVDKVYTSIPSTLYLNEDFVIYVSVDIAKAYKQAQAAVTGGLFMVGDKELNYIGIPLVTAPGLPAKHMVAGSKKNFIFLTDIMVDMEDIQIIPQRKVNGKPTAIVQGSFKAGFEYLVGAEIVLYS